MSLLSKVIDQVDIEVRQEGVKCRGRGEVRITEHTDSWLSATVNCGHRYVVELERDERELAYSCECTDYLDTLEPCQHVWATLLAAEAGGVLSPLDRQGRVDLVPLDDPDLDDYDRGSTIQIGFGGERKIPAPAKPAKSRKEKPEDWKRGFDLLRQSMASRPEANRNPWPAGRELLYVIDVASTLRGDGLTVEIMAHERKKDGSWGKPKVEPLSSEDSARLPDPADAELIALLGGAQRDSYGYYYSSGNRSSRFRLQEAQYGMLIRRMCQTGRCRLRMDIDDDSLTAVAWDDGPPWEFWLVARRDDAANRFILGGELRSGDRKMPVAEPVLLVNGGLVFTATHGAPLDHGGAFTWIMLLRRQGEISVPMAEGDELLRRLLSMPEVPRLELPEELKFERVPATPKPRLRVKKPKERDYYYSKPRLVGELSFDYEGQTVSSDDTSPGIYQPERRRMIVRDAQAERDAFERLRAIGFRQSKSSYYDREPPRLELTPSNLPGVIRTLINESWHVEADGSLYRQAGQIKMEVSSGIDWFELHGNADFDGQSVALPELLRALRKGEKTVRLDDGTFGVLPEDWLKKYGLLAGMGEEKDDHVVFGKSQVGLLDALLASQPEVSCDAVFQQARQRLLDFSGVRAADAPASFVGTLRPYQREGLGWLEFLRTFSFGGCLADDMGLGKTVQVLALLEERRLMRTGELTTAPNGNGPASNGAGTSSNTTGTASNSPPSSPNGDGALKNGAPASNGDKGPNGKASEPTRPGPSLVVAPRSLVFNWQEEAARFAPKLRVLDHTGIGRAKSADVFANYDLILTTYGTMRNDIPFLKDVAFDYVVLDEAQAVKNANSESAKAARLLGGSHRLALSGTPVQNHLGELWSLFEFLNPGMLGAAKPFQSTTAAKAVDESTRTVLARALRPFILRRTKGQVAKELPQRVEQTIHCELDTKQRKLYDDLKEHYRQSLLSKIAKEGIAKNKIQVLEALLRLRQAACHPGLLDKSKVDESSAKLDALLPQLAEVTDGGHKALVFSQFTSLLSIVRKRLDKDKVPYAYLDGRTRDRQTVVQQFQTDDNIRLFLISLKAGGVGLNLTAAEYVFLLDPWWNPAVEAQAIDRAHRIGQTRQVFAYRLIAKDTVEEKVLQLQATKRELADAIINADNSVIGKLGREDLELLLS
ncbi:MAG: helicase [Phycisphaerales bacterium]|nr:helicase [Phycisphaerales bacterium]